MRRYAITLVAVLGVWLIGFGGFTFLVDPYDVTGWLSIEGVNARKTRAHEDGYRVRVGHHLLSTEAGTIILGSSRVADGFPHDLSDWPGGFENLGMAGTSAFELARASIIASRNDNINCVIIGMDLREFGTYPRAHATYWITPLTGMHPVASHIQTSLSPNAFARALQTVIDNATGGSDTKWENAYAAEGLPARFDEEIEKRYRGYSDYVYDPQRVRFLFRGIDALLAQGKQVTLFIHPVHVWQEEAAERVGARVHEEALRRDVVAELEARNIGAADNSCFDGPELQVWDFGGYQDVSLSPPPDPSGYPENPHYYVPAHYRPVLGQAILNRLNGQEQDDPFDAASFGYRLNAATLEDILGARLERRDEWLANDEWAAWVSDRFDQLDENPPEPEREARHYLNRDDFRQLERDVARAERRAENQQ